MSDHIINSNLVSLVFTRPTFLLFLFIFENNRDYFKVNK